LRFFSNDATAAKFDRLGFAPSGIFLRLKIGNVSIDAVEHLWKGVVLTFECITSRTMCQYDSSLPERCSLEQIAGLIYINIAENFSDSREACKEHFQRLGIPLFQ
jgi:hypothetical protein